MTVGAPPPGAVVVRGLVKAFGSTLAVAGVDLDVPAGSCYGLVGPNGAGKTTTLRMATGLLRPDAGRVIVAGRDVWADPVQAKALLGVLPAGLALYERLSGRELVTYHGRLRGLDRDLVGARCEELLDVLGLAAAADILVADYSTGMRKKVGMACALLHGPRVLFLDEPFEGIDPISARALRDVLDRYRTGGGTIVLSSHVMELVERLCDHVAMIARGQVVRQGPLASVQDGGRLEDVFVSVLGAAPSRPGGLSWLDSA